MRRIGSEHSDRQQNQLETVLIWPIVIERGGTHYSAFVPDLPGCIATESSGMKHGSESIGAIAVYLQDVLATGERAPVPSREITRQKGQPYRGVRRGVAGSQAGLISSRIAVTLRCEVPLTCP